MNTRTIERPGKSTAQCVTKAGRAALKDMLDAGIKPVLHHSKDIVQFCKTGVQYHP